MQGAANRAPPHSRSGSGSGSGSGKNYQNKKFRKRSTSGVDKSHLEVTTLGLVPSLGIKFARWINPF